MALLLPPSEKQDDAMAAAECCLARAQKLTGEEIYLHTMNFSWGGRPSSPNIAPAMRFVNMAI
jgi:hypothetical protein